MGRLADGELSQTKRAIKWRANKAVSNAAKALEKQGAELTEGDVIVPGKTPKKTKPAADAIGVFTPDPAEIAPEGPQAYHCNNCHGTVAQGDAACATCEQRLNWAGL